MEHQFWHDKWARGETGFHSDRVNPLLERHIDALGVLAGDRVFVPLCGRTGDIPWLRGQGLGVVGAELSRTAVEGLFAGMGLAPRTSDCGPLTLYRADGLSVFAGDIFDLTPQMLGPVDAIYDRAALVALPKGMRDRYARHLGHLGGGARQLLITVVYDQALVPGPPFSADDDLIARLYGDSHEIRELSATVVTDGFRGGIPAMDKVWLLTPRDPVQGVEKA